MHILVVFLRSFNQPIALLLKFPCPPTPIYILLVYQGHFKLVIRTAFFCTLLREYLKKDIDNNGQKEDNVELV